jgi:hypothetical protein
MSSQDSKWTKFDSGSKPLQSKGLPFETDVAIACKAAKKRNKRERNLLEALLPYFWVFSRKEVGPPVKKRLFHRLTWFVGELFRAR